MGHSEHLSWNELHLGTIHRINFFRFLGYFAPLIKVLTEMWILHCWAQGSLSGWRGQTWALSPNLSVVTKPEHCHQTWHCHRGEQGRVPKFLCRDLPQIKLRNISLSNQKFQIVILKTDIFIHKKPTNSWLQLCLFNSRCPKAEQNSLPFGQGNLTPFPVETGNVEAN